jgi:ATP-dependent Lon protease
MPGKILAAYDHVGSRNPVLLLDEIDKLAKSAQGDPAAALLEVLDPEQNRTYVDRYLGVPFDLSETLFITTANLLDSIPPALRDRLEVLTLSGYTDEEKVEIARRFMRPRLLEDHGLEAKAVRFSRRALESIIRGYTAEAGVRELERQLAAICRKVARKRATHPKDEAKVESVRVGQVADYLGPPRYQQEFAGRSPEIGVATGLAWTGEGGAILFIEATRMPGGGNVQVTGHLGEVMLESVRAAYSFVRAHARELEIPAETVSDSDVHIHFPAGAIPKDGPSAGIAAATCLASLLSGRPVRHDVAMTGEVTLRGKLLSVGGIKEKLLAAHRARINTVLLPIGNRKDLERIPDAVRGELEIVLVNRVQDVWERALVPLLIADETEVELFQQTEVEPDREQLIRPHQATPKRSR